tara:strand:- start:134 stop:862 length:729 start_codon:yes stop_codon:yes gene_type:complete
MIVQDDQPYENTLQRADVIQDLLKNRPSGPPSNQVSYRKVEQWCPDKCKNVTKDIPDKLYYGYDKRLLFNLGIRSLDDVRKVLRKHNFDGKYVVGSKKRTYTRQCNRLWSRLEPAIKLVIKDGGKGVYRVIHKSVRSAYTLRETSIGFVYAVDYSEATKIARLMFGYIVKDPENLEVVFTRYGSSQTLLAYNTRAVEKIDSRLREMKNSIKYMKEKALKLESMKQAVVNVTVSMCDDEGKQD